MIGLKNALKTSSIYTAIAGNLKFADLDLADFESMAGMLPEYAEANAKWYISKKGYWASMARLLDAAGGNQDTNLATAPQRTFLGIPVVFVPVMNTTLANQASEKGLVYLGDMSLAATFADRAGMSIEASSEVHFLTDEIAIKGTQRFGLNVHQRGSDDVNEPAGPMIMLQTPAA